MKTPTSFSCHVMRCFVPAIVMLVLMHSASGQLAAPNEAGVTFSHIHLNVSDTGLHKKLWVDIFDASPLVMEGFTAVKIPGVQIFLRAKQPTAPSTDTPLDHIGLKVNDLDTILTEWQKLGYTVDKKFNGTRGLPSAYITMPGGVRIELQEEPDLRVKAVMDHVHFFTPGNKELRDHYVDLFGAMAYTGSTDTVAALIPGAVLIFSKSKKVQMPTKGTAIDHIGFEVEDMDAFVKMLKSREIEIIFGPKYIENHDLWVAFFTDPGGVQVEVSNGLDKY